VGIKPIERIFFNLSKKDTFLQEYFFAYYFQKLTLLNQMYPHVEGQLKGYPDHGPNHILRIMDLCEKMLKNNIPSASEAFSSMKSETLNFYEFYILLSGIVWHDIGNLIERSNHNKHIITVANRLKNIVFPDSIMKKYVIQIGEAHTGDDGVRSSIDLDDASYRNEEVNLRFIGAILRLADELDEGFIRVGTTYYDAMADTIGEEQQIFWETCRSINQIQPIPEAQNIKISAQVNKKDLFKTFNKFGKTVTFIDELIYRVQKINRERSYYMNFARKHLEFRFVNFELIVENGKPQKRTFEFTNDYGYNEFWINYSDLNPESKITGYKLQGA
jgi:hypothetical protein